MNGYIHHGTQHRKQMITIRGTGTLFFPNMYQVLAAIKAPSFLATCGLQFQSTLRTYAPSTLPEVAATY